MMKRVRGARPATRTPWDLSSELRGVQQAGAGAQSIWCRRRPECLAGVPSLFGDQCPTGWRL